ncbi:MAG: hypothetical protein Kow0037_11020 [Calditrichia bacterium]
MRRKTLLLILMLLPIILPAQNFDHYFQDQTLRIDYFHIGDAKSEIVTIDQMYVQGIWAGNPDQLIDQFDNGRYYVKVYDRDSGKLIFSRGFDSYFGEYQTSAPALKGIQRTFHESALVPYPRKPVIFVLEHRNRQNELLPFFETIINPDTVAIIKEQLDPNVKVLKTQYSGDPHKKVDVVYIAEGYTAEEYSKFEKDLKKFTEVFFSLEPYKSRRSDFNIYGVFKASAESGVDEPTHGHFKNTAVDATFNSMGSPRYLLTENNRAWRDIAAHVPYDAVFIMVNSKRYGGGGIYNFFCTFTSDNQWQNYVMLHEFGHHFSGLADEYYTSSTAYNDFYPRGVEPREPNITALTDPANLKWKELLSPGIEVPTPWEKAEFDRLDMEYQTKRGDLNEKIARLNREGAAPEEIQKTEIASEELSRTHAERMDNFLQNSRYAGKVGVFEGAGYSSEGLYRPMLDCIMFSKGQKPFCKVCEAAINRVIDHYTK